MRALARETQARKIGIQVDFSDRHNFRWYILLRIFLKTATIFLKRRQVYELQEVCLVFLCFTRRKAFFSRSFDYKIDFPLFIFGVLVSLPYRNFVIF